MGGVGRCVFSPPHASTHMQIGLTGRALKAKMCQFLLILLVPLAVANVSLVGLLGDMEKNPLS